MSFSCASSVRVASHDHVLRLKITHNLVHGPPSGAVHRVRGRLPKEFDVLWLSDLTIALSGSLDGKQVPADDIVRSGLACHLEARLKANADRLGLNNVSRPFIDDADGLSKLTLTPARPLPHASRPHANLVSLHLAYIWKSIPGRTDVVDSGHLVDETSPFCPTLFLPTETLLSRVTDQFLIYHLVGRYPLIFGSWCKRLDLEMQYVPSIARSIVDIMARSQNPGFVSKCKRLIKIARRHHRFVLDASTAALSSCTDGGTSETEIRVPVLTDENVLCESLEQLFRVGVTQRRFKPAETVRSVSLQEDDDSLLQLPSAGIEDEGTWIEMPGLSADCVQTEEVDVFAEEEWLEEHDTDMILDERKLDTQSDESLIGASVSLASITTRWTPACAITLDDGHEPATGGLCYEAGLGGSGDDGLLDDVWIGGSDSDWILDVLDGFQT